MISEELSLMRYQNYRNGPLMKSNENDEVLRGSIWYRWAEIILNLLGAERIESSGTHQYASCSAYWLDMEDSTRAPCTRMRGMEEILVTKWRAETDYHACCLLITLVKLLTERSIVLKCRHPCRQWGNITDNKESSIIYFNSTDE